jgi:predicted transcriptional regulator
MPNNPNTETSFTLRIDRELKQAFVDAARANDRSASLLIRDFMREYVARDRAASVKKARES